MSVVAVKVGHMKLTFPVKDPAKAYVSNHLWLPKEGNVLGGVRVGPIKRALEFVVPGRDGKQQVISLWEENRHHIVVPREFLPPTEYPKYKFPFVDLRPSFGSANFEDLVKTRSEEQEKAWEALKSHNNGILNLGCGKGKTKLSLKKIAQMKTPTLVIVPDGGMLEQWKQSINGSDRTPPGLRYEGELGIVKGDVFDWKKPLTLALITTLALRIRDGRIPEEFFRHFGLVVYDEVHQMGAPMFSLAAYPFYGDRIGLTATVQREDGLDPIYRYHIGEPFYSDIKQDLIPQIYYQKTTAVLDSEKAVRAGNVNIPVLRSMLALDTNANNIRYWAIKEAADQGRKILVLSHSRAQLEIFHSMFPGSGLIHGDTDREERLAILRSSQVCFAIARLGTTGVDDDRLDMLIALTPYKSLIALQQSIGRIQRPLEGKPHPIVLVFEDSLIPSLEGMCRKMKTIFKKWNFPFKVFNPGRFPRELPPHIKTIHDGLVAKYSAEAEAEDDE